MSVDNSRANGVSISLTFSLIIAILITLLMCHYLTEGDFTLLSLGIGVLAIILWHMPEIAEFTIAGNTVKLKHTLDEAEKITSDLKVLRLLTVKQFLNSTKINNGNSHQVIRGFFNFSVMYNEIVYQTDLMNEFSDEFLEVAERLLGYCAEFFSSAAGNELSTLSLVSVKYNLASIEVARNRALNTLSTAECPPLGVIHMAYFGELIIILYRLHENIEAKNYTPIQLLTFDEQSCYRRSEPLHRPSSKYRWQVDAKNV